jgi:predicted DNA-binding transcriptional regulator AlpA
MTSRAAFLKLAGLAEVAALAGKSRKRAWQITQGKTFPQPVAVLAMGPVWFESDVKAFLAKPRTSGRSAGRLRDPKGDEAAHA